MVSLWKFRQCLSCPDEANLLAVEATVFADKAFIVDVEARLRLVFCLESRLASYSLEETLERPVCLLDRHFHDVAAYFFQPLVRCLFQFIVDMLPDGTLRNAFGTNFAVLKVRLIDCLVLT